MAKKTVHHMDFETLVSVNKEVVELTNEPHEFTNADKQKMKELLAEAESVASDEGFEQGVIAKAVFLVFKIASGQHFRGGNKRTAIVAGYVFLRKNAHSIGIQDKGLLSAVDKVGIAAESLDELQRVVEALVSKAPAERRSWVTLVKETVAANKEFLTKIGS